MKNGHCLTLPILLVSLFTWAQESPGHLPTAEQKFFDWTDVAFAKEVYQERRDRLGASLRASGGGIFLVPSRDGRSHGETFRQNDDFLYLTGLELPSSILAVDADRKKTVLFVPDRDARFESASRPNDFPGRPLGQDPRLARRSGLTDVRSVDRFEPALAAWVKEGRRLRVNPGAGGPIEPLETGFIYSWSPEQSMLHHLQQTYPQAGIRTAFPEVARLRMVKSPEEVEALRRSVEVTAHGIRRAASVIRPGVDERTLEAEFEAECKRLGSQRLAFASIVKSGPNSLWPWRILASHYDRRNRAMEAGDLVIFDVGCELDYYSSDVGRTFPVSGKFTEHQKATLEMATAVADAIIAAVRPGVTFGELKEVALRAIPEGEKKYMQTGLFFGHHIGLNVGDPSLGEMPLEAGMVFTVEPWYYNHDEDVAVFVEDDVLVTERGSENLSRGLPRSAAGLEELMRPRP